MSGDYIPQPGEPISPGALRTVAAWLDTYDEMAERYWNILEVNGVGDPEQLAKVRAATDGKEMQDDLRRWADEMEPKAACAAGPDRCMDDLCRGQEIGLCGALSDHRLGVDEEDDDFGPYYVDDEEGGL